MPWTGMLKLSGKIVTPRPDLFFNARSEPSGLDAG